jgi:hypothetical protein
MDKGSPANALYDLQFAIYDDATSGTQKGSTLEGTVDVTNGLFTVALDFGAGIFTGDDRWLEIGVRTNGAVAFTTLGPRQPLTSSPYALHAKTAESAATATTATTATTLVGGIDDADANSFNELNTELSLIGTSLRLTDAGGLLSVDLAPLVDDADANSANELNTDLSLLGTSLRLTDAGGLLSVDLAPLVDDADADSANELNTELSLLGTSLQLTDAGGLLSVDLAPLVDDNDWAYFAGTGLTGSIYHSGDVIVDNDYLEVKGYGNEQAYLGGDGFGNDVQIGSLNSNVITVAAWNPTTETRMSLIASNVTALGSFIGDGSLLTGIGAAAIGPDSVGSSEIINDSILAVDIAANAVGASEIAANAVGASEIAANAVGTSEVIDNSLMAIDLAADSVTASEIAANAVGASEIAAAAVGSSEVADGSLTTADLNLTSVDARYVEAAGDTMTGPLSVYGSTTPLQLKAASNPMLEFYGGATRKAWIQAYNDDLYIANDSAGDLLFRIGSTTHMTVDNSGRVGINRTPVSRALEVQGDVGLYDSDVNIYASDGSQSVLINGDGYGYLQLYNDAGNLRAYVSGDISDAGYAAFYDAGGNYGVRIYGDYAGTGDGRVITDELQITGGSDLSEQFDIDGLSHDVKPGMIVCIDADNPGKLSVSSKAYDRKVAGVVSGADGVKPGLLMGQTGTVADGEFPVALSGRVYCMADACQGAIEPGDLITTSSVPGHGMKVLDHSQAQGAIIGKAMTPLAEGQGMVLVLVSLQ